MVKVYLLVLSAQNLRGPIAISIAPVIATMLCAAVALLPVRIVPSHAFCLPAVAADPKMQPTPDRHQAFSAKELETEVPATPCELVPAPWCWEGLGSAASGFCGGCRGPTHSTCTSNLCPLAWDVVGRPGTAPSNNLP